VEIGERLLTCLVDQNKIKYVIVNLLSNALRNTGDGGSIFVYAGRVLRDEGYGIEKAGVWGLGSGIDGENLTPGPDADFIEIAITDTGPVISEKERETLFEPFPRNESLVFAPREGLRIGLALCKRFIELHGGSIRIERLSAEDAHATGPDQKRAMETGNRFIILLPRRPSDDKLMFTNI